MKPAAARPWPIAALPALLVAAACAAYAGSFSGPFVFDDLDSIVANPTIRHLSDLPRVLAPPFAAGQTVGGRPVLNLSFAVNYAIGGLRVDGYHAANLLIHVLAGLVLFGLVRRTLRRLGGIAALRADFLGFAVALLWTVHPLQTEAVTYVVQRAESLMGLFYLLTLYGFVRCAEVEAGGRGGRPWAALSILACLAGMGTKEVMVSAPLIALLYDRTFISGSLAEAWRRHRAVLAGLAATWLVLAACVLGAHGRGGTVGGAVPVAWGTYVLTQGPAILHYLRLVFWPHPLVFDYGAEWVGAGAAAPAVALVLVLIGATLVGLRRGTAWGFLGACFFAVLAPTSLVPGIRQTMAEHRLYLALAPLLAGVVGGIGLWPGWSGRSLGRASGAFLLVVAGIFVDLTFARNVAYRSDLALWSDTVAWRPLNPYARNDLGDALKSRGRTAEAAAQFEEALRLKPDLADAQNNLGNILWEQGRRPEALAHYHRALEIRPDYAEAENNLGVADTALGRYDAALADFGRALALEPDYLEARYNLGVALADAGRWDEAIATDQAVLKERPDWADACVNLGVALANRSRVKEAGEEFRRAIAARPDYASAHYDLANALVYLGDLEEAVSEYETTLRLQPGNAAARARRDTVRAALAAGIRRP